MALRKSAKKKKSSHQHTKNRISENCYEIKIHGTIGAHNGNFSWSGRLMKVFTRKLDLSLELKNSINYNENDIAVECENSWKGETPKVQGEVSH